MKMLHTTFTFGRYCKYEVMDDSLKPSVPSASQWLYAIPSPSLGQVMDSPEFRRALTFRMYLPLYEHPCPRLHPECKWTLDVVGYHVISYSAKNIGRHQRHSTVVFSLSDLAIEAGLHATYKAKVACLGTNQVGDVLFHCPVDLLV
ncbi:hypothetical protein EON65_21930 [archaeon]|nr:MAG: hypothetical protein EON65_21930 [archaeon]